LPVAFTFIEMASTKCVVALGESNLPEVEAGDCDGPAAP
jgi:hypothetical protein